MKEKQLLGIFDSGVGGFSVFKEIRNTTDADILYFGDCARAPYGNKSEEEIRVFIKEILTQLQGQGVTHFVSACNSMSVLTTEKLLVEAGVEGKKYIDMTSAVQAMTFPKGARVLVVGTKATITSSVYQHILADKGVACEVYVPLSLAGAIEKGDTQAILKDIDSIISFVNTVSATHILYACTHYPLVHALFKEGAGAHGWSGVFVDPAEYIAMKVEAWHLEGNHTTRFETSLETDVFREYQEKIW